MVCNRCVLYVERILKELAIAYDKVNVGEIHLSNELGEGKKQELGKHLQEIGLELIDNRLNQLIEKSKKLILELARNEVSPGEKKQKLSYYLTDKLHLDYFYLSSLFSAAEGRTIEKYFIEQRTEKVKELLVFDELSLSEIAYQLEYSSVAHLSTQFKKTTGLTPSQFKKSGENKLKALDNV
ncbi:AraC family transcriptional regulator [Rhodocytophaga aerolata]|uniref:AraC family transcriptional regulator n=2 Tax=Rhodocytophaga aerolata TaxID=455078 RepID=A0ABT8RH18_9BACT|nr:AraC family transcriptional regulator [Rhodocytophaga aerolata]MDO1451279.1 AraC family transcriptional regulator [Rhodocytophaga aerolata]